MVQSLHLAPIERTTVVDEIGRRLLGLILDGGMRPGDRLPSERVLMARLGVGRSSLREAVKMLSALGIVRVAAGDGTFVSNGDITGLAGPVSWRLAMSERSMREVIEARQVVEVELAGLAAERATASEVAAIDTALATMAIDMVDAERFSQADLSFHLAIAAAGHNRVLYQVLDAMRQPLRAWIVQAHLGLAATSDLTVDHLPIVAAIRAGDRTEARAAMASHLSKASEQLLGYLAAADRALIHTEGR